MKLAEWMQKKRLGDDEVAEMVGRHRSTISRLRRGKHLPDIDLIYKFERVTKGWVKASDWNHVLEGAAGERGRKP